MKRVTPSLVALIGVVGFAINYATLAAVARVAGFEVWQAALFPLLLDAGMIVAHLAYLQFRAAGQSSRWVYAAMYGTVALSVTFAVSHTPLTGDIARDALAVIAWALPPVLLLVAIEVLARLLTLQPAQPAIVERDPVIDAPQPEPVRVEAPQNERLTFSEFEAMLNAGQVAKPLTGAAIAEIANVHPATGGRWLKKLNGKAK